jgi:hypothetical protein
VITNGAKRQPQKISCPNRYTHFNPKIRIIQGNIGAANIATTAGKIGK